MHALQRTTLLHPAVGWSTQRIGLRCRVLVWHAGQHNRFSTHWIEKKQKKHAANNRWPKHTRGRTSCTFSVSWFYVMSKRDRGWLGWGVGCAVMRTKYIYSLHLRSCSKDERGHGGGKPDVDRHHLRADVLHGIEKSQPCDDGAPGTVHVQVDGLRAVFGIEVLSTAQRDKRRNPDETCETAGWGWSYGSSVCVCENMKV